MTVGTKRLVTVSEAHTRNVASRVVEMQYCGVAPHILEQQSIDSPQIKEAVKELLEVNDLFVQPL